MATYYKLTITYPNGATEELDESFYALEKAVDYGNALLNQIPGNASFKGKRKLESFFTIVRFASDGREMVYDSRAAE
jgi:hypothetical protein